MRPVKFTKENVEKVFKTIDHYGGFELKILDPDVDHSSFYAMILTCEFNDTLEKYRRRIIPCTIFSYLPSNWYYYISSDRDGFPYIMFDGSYTKLYD